MERALTLDGCLDGCRSGKRGAAAFLWLIGSGGKTTLGLAFARRAAAREGSCIFTTSTRVSCPGEGDGVEAIVQSRDPERAPRLAKRALARHRLVAFGGAWTDGKMMAPPLACITALEGAGAGMVVVEADGARGRPLKLFRSWEPVLPEKPFRLGLVVGFQAFGEPLDETTVYGRGDVDSEEGAVDEGALYELLSDEAGGLSRLAPRSWVFLNGIRPPHRSAAAAVAQWLLEREPRVEAVIGVGFGTPNGPYTEWRRNEA